MCVREVVKVMWSSTERVLGGGREECFEDQIRSIRVEICWVQAIERQPWSGSNSTETNNEKAKAASEGKGCIRGFGGPKNGSVGSEPRPGRGRMAIENGREEVEGAYGAEASEGVCQRMCVVAL